MCASNRGVHLENLAFFRSCTPQNMDYRQKMVLASNKTHSNNKGENDDDDEDLEALRMAALQSLRTKNNLKPDLQVRSRAKINTPQIAQPCTFYKGQRPNRLTYRQPQLARQNGNLYFQKHRNPNLIAIVPVEEDILLSTEPLRKPQDIGSTMQNQTSDESKFCRYKDNASCSDEDDEGDRTGSTSAKLKVEPRQDRGVITISNELGDADNLSTHSESPQHSESDEKEEDDDDVLLMADLEEEDSLERLMDEMEKEMSIDKADMIEKMHPKIENRSTRDEEVSKKQQAKSKLELRRTNRSSSPLVHSSISSVLKNEPRPMSPYNASWPTHRRGSLSPKPRSRKKSPKRSPRRSPPRLTRKLQSDGGRDLRFRSPKKSPSHFSPRPRLSPRLSPRRSPRRSPLKRTPPRLSPRLSPRPKSPKTPPRCRSRSPGISLRLPRSRSPRSSPRRSPQSRLSPRKFSPRPRSPKLSPRLRSPRLTPRHLSPRPRSPKTSPRRMSPRLKTPRTSPRLSPRRLSPRVRSPRFSPHRRMSPQCKSPAVSPRRSPWSSPRNSPRLSPRRRKSPKELPRKIKPRSNTPCNRQSPLSKRGLSPSSKGKVPPVDLVKGRPKQKDESYEKVALVDTGKSTDGSVNDPVLEARRRKFESTKPIDPINENKKIKLSRKECRKKKSDLPHETQISTTNTRTPHKLSDGDCETIQNDLYLGVDFELEDLEEPVEDSPAATIASTINLCSEIEPAKLEREKLVKKKKKKDKELYQVHKTKGELPLSERIGKEKKCKKRKEATNDVPAENSETVFEDLIVEEEEGDLRTELSRRRAERLNRTGPLHQQSVRLVQSAFKGVVREVVKSNAKSIRKQLVKVDDKPNQNEVRRVTVLHRPVTEFRETEDESTVDSKVPIRFRLGLNKLGQDTRESKISRKNSKRQSRKVKHTNNLSSIDAEYLC
ncbi:serine/arginine repetitive matrix protein 1 isoform X1 [Neodiprion pinetum]|uniref:serine/arginine repetitive matrix protein 1 isoform X1 n=2 Tax=Neodiprion pinetum TaxID=441929 RepID=UPI001EDE4629|nr:serine/arginine repetitive matrix protein 1-like isoform X1 [Neodiprion pinetum]